MVKKYLKSKTSAVKSVKPTLGKEKTKEFLKKFMYGTQGVAGREMEGQLGYPEGSMNYEMPGN